MTAIQIEGNLIAPDMTSDILAGDIKGQTAVDFGLPKTEKLEDEITLAWGEARDYWSIFQRRLDRLEEGETATSLTREYWTLALSQRERGTGGEGLKQAQEQALLSLKICDPACGSGHFLLAAARRLGILILMRCLLRQQERLCQQRGGLA